jgi:hypothetical protein
MIRKLLCNTVVSLVTLHAVLVLTGPQAQAQVVKPFKIKGAGTADYIPVVPDVPVYHDASGEATDLGRYDGSGFYQLLGLTGPTTGTFDSAAPFIFTGANGDQLAFTYGDTTNGAAEAGQVSLYSAGGGLVFAVWVAEFNPVPALCTGRFAKVIGGSVIMTAVSEPFVLGGTDPVGYSWTGEGSIEYRKGG